MVFEARKGFLNNVDKMSILKDDLQDEIFSDNTQLMLFELNKINKLADESLDYVWNMLYGKNRENDEINDINIDKDKDIDGYMSKYIKIINDKPEVINRLDELLDSIVNQLQNFVGTNNYDSISKKMKSYMFILIKGDSIKGDSIKGDTIKGDGIKGNSINGDSIKKYNDKPPKTFSIIEKILNCFICEKFMNEKYYEKVGWDCILFDT